MKKKNNHPTAWDEMEANLEVKVDAYIEMLTEKLRSLPKSERAKWLKDGKWLENFMDKAIHYATTMLLLDAKRSQAEDSPVDAKLAAQLFKSSEFGWSLDMIHRAAETKNEQFFIDFGKCLSGQMKPELWDRLDYAIAWILCFAPRISARRAVGFLEKFGNFKITEDLFRMRKMRLRRAVR